MEGGGGTFALCTPSIQINVLAIYPNALPLNITQYGYITPAFSRSPWWGEVNMATPLPSRRPHGGKKSTYKGVDVVEMSKKCVKKGESGCKSKYTISPY